MISFLQFNRRDIQSKSNYLNNHGVCLNMSIHRGVFIVTLFDLHGFYVEVCYEKETNMISRINSFASLKKLEPFLKQINIEEIILLLKAV